VRIRNCFVTAVIFVAIATASCGSDSAIVGYDRAEENFWRGFLADPSNTLPKRVLESEYLAPFVVDGTFVPPTLPERPTRKQIDDYGNFQPILYGFVGYKNEYNDVFVKYMDPWETESGFAPSKKADICAIQRSLTPAEVTRPFPRSDCLPKWAIASPPTFLEPPSTQALP
jgi:hypothetical protein